MSESNCPICGYGGSKWIVSRVIEGKLFTVRQCRVCDHGYMSPLPATDLLSHLAPDYGLGIDNTMKNKGAMSHFDHLFETWINMHFPTQERSMLTVTNEEGAFESVARKYGWNASPLLFKDLMLLLSESSERAGGELLPDFAGKFSLIVLNQVLEHFFDPVKALLVISSWLKPGGHILVVVPNMDSDEFKAEGHKWKYINIPFHINYFNKLSLDTLFTKKMSENGMNFIKVFQTTFPPPGHKEGESISTLYRLE